MNNQEKTEKENEIHQIYNFSDKKFYQLEFFEI